MIRETAPHEVEIWEDDPFNLEESLDEDVAHFIWQAVDNIKLAKNTSEQLGADQNAWSQEVALPLTNLALGPHRSAFLETVSIGVFKAFRFSFVSVAMCQTNNASQSQALDSQYIRRETRIRMDGLRPLLEILCCLVDGGRAYCKLNQLCLSPPCTVPLSHPLPNSPGPG